MKVSFDGMRRNATNSMNGLHDAIKDIIESDNNYADESEKQELIEKFNEAAMSVDMFNCLFDDSVEDDMNDLTDSLSINRIDT